MRKILLYCCYINLTGSSIYLKYRNLGHINQEDLAYDSLKIIVNKFIILTKFEHFHNEAFKAETRKEYEKALQIRLEGLKLKTLTDLQRSDLHVGNGGTYLSLNDYTNAASCFDKAFELTKHEKFPYDEQYKKNIDCYNKANRKKDTIILVENC
jgi:tetratricopeptide (TPR) repeat protein